MPPICLWHRKQVRAWCNTSSGHTNPGAVQHMNTKAISRNHATGIHVYLVALDCWWWNIVGKVQLRQCTPFNWSVSDPNRNKNIALVQLHFMLLHHWISALVILNYVNYHKYTFIFFSFLYIQVVHSVEIFWVFFVFFLNRVPFIRTFTDVGGLVTL